MQRILVPVMFALAVVAGPAVALLASPPAAGSPVVVIAADADGAVLRAGGTPVGPRARLGVLGSSPDPDFIQRLRDGGAWLVLDGRAIAAICGVAS